MKNMVITRFMKNIGIFWCYMYLYWSCICCPEPREVSVLLDATEDAQVELLVSYVTYKAKWTPKYDIRVYSNERQLKVCSISQVVQNVQE